VHEAILSGGDPLSLSNRRLGDLFARLETTPVKTVRIHTRFPIVVPERIDDGLLLLLERTPLRVVEVVHSNHGNELDEHVQAALLALRTRVGALLNQAVLLRGVNDDAETLTALFRGLVRERERPYYLLQADPVRGSSHLRTPLETGIRLMEALQGRLSGIALPKLIVDTPGGLGKVPVGPDYVISRSDGVTRFRTFRGVEVEYLDPPATPE
jgi:lysine 2,3-aminomutase